MPECHSCTRAPGPYCWTDCKLSEEPNHHGKNHVSIDQIANLIPAPEPTEPPSDYSASVSFIRTLCGMGMINREIVFSRIMGIGYESLAKNINAIVSKKMTFQAIHGRVKKLLEDPAVSELFREMVTRQNRKVGVGNGKRAACGTGCPTNLERLPGLLAAKAEAVSRVKGIKANGKACGRLDVQALKRERAVIAVMEREIVRCWKFPYRVG